MNKIIKELEGKGADAFAGIPKNYFEGLHDKIMQKSYRKAKNKLFFIRPPFLAIAASLMIFAGIGLVLLLSHENNNSEMLLAETKTQHAVENLTSGNAWFDSAISALQPDDTSINANPLTGTETTDGLNNLFTELDELPVDVIIEYLTEIDELGF